MRSKEFIREAGRNGSMDDFGQPINQPPTDAEYAARQAQGAKTGAAIKDFFSGTPKELKPAPANFPTIDPIARSNAGYLPATPQEIAAFQAANPYYGKVIGRNGLPINGGKVLAGGEQNVLQAAQAAAAPVAAAMPAYQARDLPDPRSYDRTEPAYADRFKPGQSATTGAATDDSAARAAAAAERNRKPITTTAPAPAPAPAPPAPVKPAAVVPAPVKPAAVVPAPVQTDPRVYGPKGEIILPNAAGVNDLDVYKTSEIDRYGGETTRKKNDSAPAQNVTPPAKFNMSPTVWSYAINMGLIQNGKPVDSAIRAFQKKNGLEVDGIIGNDTSTAIISAATTGMPNIGRGNQGGAAVGNNSTPATTGGYPNPVTDPEGYKKEINRRLLKKYAGNEQPAASNATPAAAETGGPPPGSGTIMPGVKDSKGRQVYKRPDSSVMAWDPTTQLFSFYDAPSVSRGSESGKNYVNPDQPRGAHPTNMSYDKNGKALFPMPSPFANQNAQPAPAGDSVTVKSGDTLSKIAAANGTTVPAIMAANPSIKDPNRIAAGQTVKLRESSDLARIRHLAGLTRN